MSAVVRLRDAAVLEVSDTSLEALRAWVVDPATRVEDIAWNAGEFQSVRDWLKAHRSAQELRRKAVRVELIALRRVGLGGLAAKLTGSNQLKPVAKWLAELPDEGFSNLLDEITGEETPITLWRASKREEDKVQKWIQHEDELSGRPHYNPPTQRYRDGFLGPAEAARRLLHDMQLEGTTFTVQEAADRLTLLLEEDGIHVHQAMRGTPVTQLVRNAIHRATDGYEVLVNREGETARVPDFVTYETSNGVARVPWSSASIAQLQAFVEMHEDKARVLAQRAQEYRTLLDGLTTVTPDDSASCARTLTEARRRRNFRAALAEGGDVA